MPTVELESREGSVMLSFQSDEQGEFTGQLPKGQPLEGARARGYAACRRGPGHDRRVRTGGRSAGRDPSPREHATRAGDRRGRSRRARSGRVLQSVRVGPCLPEDGRFGATSSCAGLPYGELVLSATAMDGRTSETVKASLGETVRAASVRLIVRDRMSLSGVVTSSAGPVARALVLGLPKLADGSVAILDVAQAVTGADGVFELDVRGASTSGRSRRDAAGAGPGRQDDCAAGSGPCVPGSCPRLAGPCGCAGVVPWTSSTGASHPPRSCCRGACSISACSSSGRARTGFAFEPGTTEIVLPRLAARGLSRLLSRPLDRGWTSGCRLDGGFCPAGASTASCRRVAS